MVQVVRNSVIRTDEYRFYTHLSSFQFRHGTVYHKYEFVNQVSGVNTQAVESFHNELKLQIKAKKGIATCKRQEFLNVLFFIFNNKADLLGGFIGELK